MPFNLTNTGENRLADFLLRNGPRRFPDSWHIALATAVDEEGITEVAGAGYGRQSVPRSLAAWAGTQGPGTILPSTGATHATSNNAPLSFGVAGAAWGTVTHVGLMDEAAAGLCWLWVPLPVPVVVNAADEVAFQAGALQVVMGATGGMSDWLASRLIDELFRGVEWARPAEWHLGYAISVPTNAAPGAEPAAGGYARATYPITFDSMSSTVDAFDTGPSDAGTSGRVANHEAITFPVPTANQGTATHVQAFTPDGDFLFWRALEQPKTMSAGGLAPRFDPLDLAFLLS